MSKEYPLLLKPGRMGPLEIPNRIVMAPMGSLNGDDDGHVTDKGVRFYVDIAKGGLGLIVVEATYIDEELSKSKPNVFGISKDSHITRMALLATCIHDQDVKCVLQINHIGKQISQAGKKDSLGPSEMVEMLGGKYPFPIRGITREGIVKLKEDFAMAAWRAKVAGFDGVQVHGALGHLINMFCTPFYNRRTDEYGGSPENRIRLFVEIIDAIQEKCGRDFPIIARMCGCDFDPDGITMEEGIIHAKALEKTGVTALHVVAGSNRNVRSINIQYDPRGDFLSVAEEMKKAGIKTPIIIDGGLSTPDIAEQALADGKADFIGLGRPILADPDWAKKLKEDRPEDIVPCIRCTMGCVGTMEKYNSAVEMICSVNPRCNYAGYREIAPLVKKKKVCIVGGGPGGMEAARLAAIRGHEVTLYEKRKLGGTMHEAAFDPDLKGDILLLVDYYLAQIKKLNINVIYEEATTQTILAGDYDAVIVATGATPRKTKLAGTDKLHVYSILEYTEKNKDIELGQTVLIVGGGFVSGEIALSLAKKGKKVIMSTRRKNMLEVGNDNSSPMQQRLTALLFQHGVDIKLDLNLTEITDDGAVLAGANGEKTEIKCDNVLLCRGYNRADGLYKELEGQVKELYKVGDCVQPRLIGDAIHEGWLAANRI